MITLQSLFISSIFLSSSKISSSVSFSGRFKASLVPTCKMIYSGLCRKIGFILSCMSLTLAPEKRFTLTLHFWDSRPGCRPETIEPPAIHAVPFGHGQSSLLSNVTLSFLSVSQITDWYRLVIWWIYLCRLFSLNYLYIANIFHEQMKQKMNTVSRKIHNIYSSVLNCRSWEVKFAIFVPKIAVLPRNAFNCYKRIT